MLIRISECWSGVRSSQTRLPFKYGKACLTRCPQLLIRVTLENDSGTAFGYAADCLPPGWFDKRSDRDYVQQLTDLQRIILHVGNEYRQAFQSRAPFFDTWLELQSIVHTWGRDFDMAPLAMSFGTSLYERAIIDAICRVQGITFHRLLSDNVLALDGGRIFDELKGSNVVDWIEPAPRRTMWVRHTVGLADPLTQVDLVGDATIPHDSFPVTLEDYLQKTGLRYLKIKVSNQLERDLERLRIIAHLIEQHGCQGGAISLDGNEQYQNGHELSQLLAAIRQDDRLSRLWQDVCWIEQPIERSAAMQPGVREFLDSIDDDKPVIIDESDDQLDSFRKAVDIGYRGTSVKSCKGVIKGLLNSGLVRHFNGRASDSNRYVLSAEDLCCVGVVSVQSDLCLSASLGIEHAERNGHHFHPGLNYLSNDCQRVALAEHGDFYSEHAGIIAPRLENGQFQLGSILANGFGFISSPDEATFESFDQWSAADWENQ